MKQFFWALLLLLVLAIEVEAATDLSTISLDMEPVFTFGAAVVAALLGFFALRKAIKLTNRS